MYFVLTRRKADTMAIFSDVHVIMNSLVKQNEGKIALTETDITNTASFGEKILASNLDSSKDVVFKSLMDRIGKTIIDMLSYDNKFARIFKDAFAYGCVLQTIHVANFEARTSGVYDNLDNGDVDGDLYKMFLPTVDQTLFENAQPWEFAVTITDEQIKSAFTNEETLAGFINGIFIAMYNSITKYLETCARTCYENLIIADINKGGNVAINVLQAYYDETGIELSDVRGSQNYYEYNADFSRWLTSLFTDKIGMLEEMTVLFNHKEYETFTPRDMCHFVINGKIADNIKRFMTSNVYNDELVSMPNYAEISSWQAIGTNGSLDARLSVYAKYKNPAYVSGGAEPEYISANKKVIAVMHDDRVLSLTLKDRRSVSIPNEHGARRNVFEQGVVCNFVNLGQNSIVFYVDTVIKPVDVHLDKNTASILTTDSLTLVAPKNPNDAVLTWGTSDSSVATVSNGVITVVGAGTCVISVTATKNGVTAVDTCLLTISAPANNNANTRKK